jgi:predicted nucleic acid-binding Zn ribbon protein
MANESKLTPELHCSACDAIIDPGNQFCPGCGLRLTAEAKAAVYVEGPRFPLWWVITFALGMVVIIAAVFSH